MALKFWHLPDYKGFSNEDEVRTAIRNGRPAAAGTDGTQVFRVVASLRAGHRRAFLLAEA